MVDEQQPVDEPLPVEQPPVDEALPVKQPAVDEQQPVDEPLPAEQPVVDEQPPLTNHYRSNSHLLTNHYRSSSHLVDEQVAAEDAALLEEPPAVQEQSSVEDGGPVEHPAQLDEPAPVEEHESVAAETAVASAELEPEAAHQQMLAGVDLELSDGDELANSSTELAPELERVHVGSGDDFSARGVDEVDDFQPGVGAVDAESGGTLDDEGVDSEAVGDVKLHDDADANLSALEALEEAVPSEKQSYADIQSYPEEGRSFDDAEALEMSSLERMKAPLTLLTRPTMRHRLSLRAK